MDDQTPLRYATNLENEGVVKLLLEREDVDPNRPDKHGATPLGYAVYGGNGRVVKLLLGREDVDPNRPDENGLTPLFVCFPGIRRSGEAIAKLGRHQPQRVR